MNFGYAISILINQSELLKDIKNWRKGEIPQYNKDRIKQLQQAISILKKVDEVK